MASGSSAFDINNGSYRLAGTVAWSISGSTVTWTMSWTSYEYIVWSSSERAYIFQGLTNGRVRLYVGNASADSSANAYSGYPWGTHSSRTSAGWQQIRTGTVTLTTTLVTGAVTARPYIVPSGTSGSLSFALAWAVAYNGNGADGGSTAGQTKVRDTALTLRQNGFTRAKYAFVEWNTAANGGGTAYAGGASYTGNAALTLYAIWKKTNVPIYGRVGDRIVQVERAYARVGDAVREVTVWGRVGDRIIEFK